MHLLIDDKNNDLFTELLKNKKFINTKNNKGQTLLLYSIAKGRKEFALSLIKAGADVNIPDNKGYTPLYIADNRNYIQIINLLNKKEAKPGNIKPELILPTGNNAIVSCLAYSSDQKYILAGTGDWNDFQGTVKLWETESAKEIKTFSGHKGGIRSVSFSPCGKYFVSSTYKEEIKLWELATGFDIKTIKGNCPIYITLNGKTYLLTEINIY